MHYCDTIGTGYPIATGSTLILITPITDTHTGIKEVVQALIFQCSTKYMKSFIIMWWFQYNI